MTQPPRSVPAGVLHPMSVCLTFVFPAAGQRWLGAWHTSRPRPASWLSRPMASPTMSNPCADAGVAGYVLKNLDSAGLTDAVRRVHAGRTFFQKAAKAVSDSGDGRSLAEPLTMRELDVLRLVAEGASNREAAESLGVSAKTVEAHLSSVYGKLRVRSRTEAVVTAVARRNHLRRPVGPHQVAMSR